MLYGMNRFGLAVVCAAALVLAVMAEEAAAAGRSGGHGSGGSHAGHSGSHHSGSHSHHNHGHHSHSRVFVGVGVGAPLFWGPAYYGPAYYAPGYYYPPPAPVYIEQNPAPIEQGSQYWYYCQSARAYYPYVNGCPEGWQRVLPQPPAG